jgi:hypothetical protein
MAAAAPTRGRSKRASDKTSQNGRPRVNRERRAKTQSANKSKSR